MLYFKQIKINQVDMPVLLEYLYEETNYTTSEFQATPHSCLQAMNFVVKLIVFTEENQLQHFYIAHLNQCHLNQCFLSNFH